MDTLIKRLHIAIAKAHQNGCKVFISLAGGYLSPEWDANWNKLTLPANRPFALTTLQEEAPIVRALSGNLGYTLHLDPENAGGLRLTHQWNDAASFAAYRATPGFKAVGDELFPMMVGKPVTAVFEATQMVT